MANRIYSIVVLWLLATTLIILRADAASEPSASVPSVDVHVNSFPSRAIDDERHVVRTNADRTATRPSKNRNLQVEDMGRLFSDLFDTPIDQWTGWQWLLVLVLLFILSFLCRCLSCACCQRSPYGYYPGGYYGGRRYYGGGGNGSCCSCSDIFWCLCCFEWCCRDCQDVDECCNVAREAAYQGGDMV